eukprot:TRINITY_DN2665_c0_g3_i1.p3 TRINITY_DN2665_c0_g3~~TRINITY_DN2665_c0_g3_i1.p3  ORF type:complete len:101 (+),score=19.75 TRINITY_DN2665_c0_g3_i1:226-528(+)
MERCCSFKPSKYLRAVFAHASNRTKLHLVSRIHVQDMNVGMFDLYVSEFLEGPYVSVEKKICVPHGKQRVIKVGMLPCRYLKVVMKKGVPFLDHQKYSKE